MEKTPLEKLVIQSRERADLYLKQAYDLEGCNEDARMFDLYRRAGRYAMVHQYLLGRMRGSELHVDGNRDFWYQRRYNDNDAVGLARMLAKLIFR